VTCDPYRAGRSTPGFHWYVGLIGFVQLECYIGFSRRNSLSFIIQLRRVHRAALILQHQFCWTCTAYCLFLLMSCCLCIIQAHFCAFYRGRPYEVALRVAACLSVCVFVSNLFLLSHGPVYFCFSYLFMMHFIEFHNVCISQLFVDNFLWTWCVFRLHF